MAASNFQAHKSFSVFLALSMTLFLLQLNKVNSAKVLSFSFPNFESIPEDIKLQGDALVTSGKLRLTKVEDGEPVASSIGQALYAAPIQIWDSTTGNVASFATSFSFVIKAQNRSSPADGIAFFLARPDIQPQQPGGGFLGLFKDQYYNKSNQIVAVEFDTFINKAFDPANKHIGIDVNSIRSTKTASWGWRNGEVANVGITYDAPTKTLVAYLTYRGRKTSYIISAGVDLKEVLPSWVKVGFSATTSLLEGHGQTNDVLSWSFASTFSGGDYDATENNVHLASYAE